MSDKSIIRIKEKDFINNSFSLTVSFITKNGTEEEINTDFNNASFSETDNLLEWHFEEYISTPYDDGNLTNSLKAIENYGKNLFDSLIIEDIAFQYKKEYAEYGPENLTIEIIGSSPTFHSIYWESLWDKKQITPLATQGVSFIRRNVKPTAVKAIAKPSSMINLLIVTARPGEEDDVNYRTIQRPLIDLIQKTEIPINPHILRPGTYESLIRHLDDKSGYYHIIHFDLHGGLLDYSSYKYYQDLAEESGIINNGYGLIKLNEAYFKDQEKSFIFFESNQKNIPVPVEGELLANMLENHRIPICILNACQSAMQSNSEHETSLGRILSERGLQTVIAMRYSIAVTAAEIFMKTLYKQLYSGELTENAITNCRKELFRSKKRRANYNY